MTNLHRWLAASTCFGLLCAAATLVAAPPQGGAVRQGDTEPKHGGVSAGGVPSPADVESPPSPPVKRPASEPFDAAYIPADAAMAIVIRPQPLLRGPNAEMMPIEVITAVGMQQVGVDPVQIREAVGFLIPPADLSGEPSFGIVVRFLKPYDSAALVAKLQVAEKATDGGIDFYQFGSRRKACVYLPDDHTVIFAMQPVLPKMLAAKGANSQLIRLLKSTDFSGTYTALISLDSMRLLVNKALESAPPLPPELEQFRKLPELTSSAKIRVDLAQGLDLSVTLHAVSDDAAGEIAELETKALAMGRQLVLGQMAAEMKNSSDDPVQQAVGKYVNRIVNRLFDQVKPERAGRNVRLAMHADGGPAMIGVAVSLLLPAVSSARGAARRVQSQNNLRQIALAILNFESANAKFPARAIFDKGGKPLLSWRVQILPYIEGDALYRQFHLDEPWDSEHNKALIAQMPQVYANPNVPLPPGKTNYLAPVGAGTVFEGTKGCRVSDITDGLSNTLMVVEANPDKAVDWTKPDDLTVDLAKPLNGLGKMPIGGFTGVFCDGHVALISNVVDPQVLKAMFTRNGGEPVASP